MQRCTELNVTNRSRAYPERHRKEIQKGVDSFSVFGFEGTLSSDAGTAENAERSQSSLRSRTFSSIAQW